MNTYSGFHRIFREYFFRHYLWFQSIHLQVQAQSLHHTAMAQIFLDDIIDLTFDFLVTMINEVKDCQIIEENHK